MRELTVRLRFTKESLGNVKDRKGGGKFRLPRNPGGRVTFLASWHHTNMRFAAQLLGRHQDEVGKILWDIQVDGQTRADPWHRRYYSDAKGKVRYCFHEAFMPDQVVGINCVVPAAISDEDFWTLVSMAGQYRGLSPWHPGEYGFYEVESIRPRRATRPAADNSEGKQQRSSSGLPTC
jgi:hypothetical protein